MHKHPKPHFISHQGKWLACYGHVKGAEMVVAEGRTLRLANFNYWAALEPQPQAKQSFIITAWRRLFCKHDWKHLRSIHGDERNYATDEWGCPKCGKHRYSGGIHG